MNRNSRITGRKTKKSKKNPVSVVNRIERMDHPPQVNGYNVSHTIRLRFTVTAASASFGITSDNILDTVLIAVSAVQGFKLFDIFRIRQVEIWGAAALGTPSTITCIFTTASGDQLIHTDTSLGVKPAYVNAVPNTQSLASFWTSTAGVTMFVITCPAGSVLDLSCDFRTTNAAAAAAVNALVGATLGELYYRGLDGVAIATTNFPPVAGVARI